MGSARAYVTALNKLITYIKSQQVRRQKNAIAHELTPAACTLAPEAWPKSYIGIWSRHQ